MHRLQLLRKGFTLVGFLGAGCAMFLISYAQSPFMAMCMLCTEASFNALHASGFKANYQDLTESHRGLLGGFGNTVATLASALGPILTADLLMEYHSWPLLFSMICVIFCSMGGAYACLGNARSLDRPVGRIQPK